MEFIKEFQSSRLSVLNNSGINFYKSTSLKEKMDSFNTSIQRLLDILNIFRGVFTLAFVGIGVISAFSLNSLMLSLGTAGIIFLIAISLSSLMPGLAPMVSQYFLGLAIGLVIGNILKWITRRTLNN